VDSTGELQPPSICEEWGAKATRGLTLRMLCGAWLLPAASLVWMGFASTGLREVDDASLALALGRTQALALLLTVLGAPLAATAFLRSPAGEPARPPRLREEPVGLGLRPPWRPRTGIEAGLGLAGHLICLVLAVSSAAAGVAWPSLSPALFPAAALAGFWAALALPRWLLARPGADAGPLAALVVGIAFQLTVGWLHLAHPGGVASPALVAEGMVLAWAATAAARVDVFPQPHRESSPVGRSPLPAGAGRSVAAAGALSQAPGRRSIPGAAVGRLPPAS
jgi:hypothetical protein